MFWMACYSYIADITTLSERTKRLSYLDATFPAGFFMGLNDITYLALGYYDLPLLGMAMSGRINKYFGYYANFGLGIVMICICMAYTVFFLKVA